MGALGGGYWRDGRLVMDAVGRVDEEAGGWWFGGGYWRVVRMVGDVGGW